MEKYAQGNNSTVMNEEGIRKRHDKVTTKRLWLVLGHDIKMRYETCNEAHMRRNFELITRKLENGRANGLAFH